jgi:nucleotide-binding universal stress UspA family protein
LYELKVLFATDFDGQKSDIEAGLQLATKLARERAATLVILHVVPIDPADGEANLYRAVDLVTDSSLRKLERLVPNDPGVAFRHALEVGNPEQRIAAFVEREGVELLVMETRVRSGFKHLLGRSLVERLVQRVRCPIVTFCARNMPREQLPSSTPTPASPEALRRLLDTRVNALVTWMHLQREAARCIAEQPSIREGIATVCRNPAERAFVPAIRSMLELELSEHQRALGAVGVEVIHAGRSVLRLGARARRDDAFADFVRLLRRDAPATSVPLEGEMESTAPNGLVLAGANVVGKREDSAYVLFAFDARREDRASVALVRSRLQLAHEPTHRARSQAADADGGSGDSGRRRVRLGRLSRLSRRRSDRRLALARGLRVWRRCRDGPPARVSLSHRS